jgi:cellobiose phosphorylase
MIAGLFVFCGKQYVELCHKIAKNGEAQRARQCLDNMTEAVRKYGWDGEWYLRAYDFYGNKIGSDENEEGKIFIESQGFCTMAGIGQEDGMVDKALDSCKKYLDSPHGMVLNHPAFTK